jgi:hypothetical protein
MWNLAFCQPGSPRRLEISFLAAVFCEWLSKEMGVTGKSGSSHLPLLFVCLVGWFLQYWGLNSSLVFSRQILYHLSHASTPSFFEGHKKPISNTS